MKMKLHTFAFVTLAFAGAILTARADQNLAGNVTVTGGSTSGNLTVTGTVDVNGGGFTFGTQDSSFGAGLIYTDSNTDTLNFFLNRAPASWLWQHTTIAAMRLDSNHKLLLYQTDGTTLGAAIDPGAYTLSLGTSTLYRDSSGALKTDGAFVVGGSFTAPTYTATNGTLTGGVTGLTLNAGGTNQSIAFTPSGTGVNRLQGLGTQIAGTTLFGTNTDNSNGRLQLAAHVTAAGGIGFGSDTVLYRSAAGTLKTDGKLTVAGNARFDGAVRIAPQGDLSMGEFTSEP